MFKAQEEKFSGKTPATQAVRSTKGEVVGESS